MFYEQLKNACNAKNTTITKLVVDLGMSKGNITSWKNGGKPSIEVLEKIANHLDVSTDYLLGKTDIKKPLPDKEQGGNPRFSVMARASVKMSDEQIEQLYKMAKVLFPDAFEDNDD